MNIIHRQRKKTSNACARHAGTSLIEVVAIMSVGAVVTGIVVTSMSALFRYDRQATQHNAEREQIQLLARHLRDDIREATESRFVPSEQMLTLVHDDQEFISYRLFSNHAERTIRSGELSETARIRIPPTLQITSVPAETKAGELICIRFNTSQNENEHAELQVAPNWNLEIQATVGRDLPIATDETSYQ
jgi:hypothetical protein